MSHVEIGLGYIEHKIKKLIQRYRHATADIVDTSADFGIRSQYACARQIPDIEIVPYGCTATPYRDRLPPHCAIKEDANGALATLQILPLAVWYGRPQNNVL
jgi:hypothetical protein